VRAKTRTYVHVDEFALCVREKVRTDASEVFVYVYVCMCVCVHMYVYARLCTCVRHDVSLDCAANASKYLGARAHGNP
jgi:hypothetical protein